MHIREAAPEEEDQDTPELHELARRVPEADPSVACLIPVGVCESTIEPLQEEWISAEIALWQVLAVSLAELPEEARPLQGIERDADHVLFPLDRGPNAGDGPDGARDVVRNVVLMRAE